MNNDKLLGILKDRPEAYEKSTMKFWDDDHISKGMLEAHLNPETDAATRRPDFVSKSARWIAEFARGKSRPKLLDLGCGPGITLSCLPKWAAASGAMRPTPVCIPFSDMMKPIPI